MGMIVCSARFPGKSQTKENAYPTIPTSIANSLAAAVIAR
jgi:hypothetical protein